MNQILNTLTTSAAPMNANATHAPLLPRRLLVVDDEEVVCQLVQGFLGHEGWEVDSVKTIDDAGKKFAEFNYPVIVCDVHLPGNSTDLLRSVKTTRPMTQVIMFTGDPTVGTAREAIQYGAYEYVPKPCHREELVHIVQRAYEKHLLLVEQSRLQAENDIYRRRLEDLVEKRSVQLRESELRYRAIFNRAVDAIFLVDRKTWNICDHNIAATRFLNLHSADLMDRPITEFVFDQLNDVMRSENGGKHHEWHFERLSFKASGDKSKMAQVSIGTVEFDDQACLQIVARDVTDQATLLERNRIMESELLNEQRLAAIGLLASGIAHNINTPLMGIYGAAQLVKMKHPEMNDLDGIITQVERINAIVRNLMWKSRQEQDTRFQEIDLNELLREELKFLEADMEFKHNVTKHFEFADDIPTIMGRYSDFSQSIVNVIRNGLDAMHECENKDLYVTSSRSDDEIRVAIRDTGCGISDESREKIFLPFYTTKPLARGEESEEPTGTGLGLSTVKKLLTPYGARFEIESTPCGGTNFTICLPIKQNLAEHHDDQEFPGQ
jgi:PAS domain S-box-containing protein